MKPDRKYPQEGQAVPPKKLALPIRMLFTVVLLAVFLSGVGALVRLSLYLGEPFPGIMYFFRKEIELATVGYMTPLSWSGMQAGLRGNDRILCIDGYQPFADQYQLSQAPQYAAVVCPNGLLNFTLLAEQTWKSDHPTLDFTVERGGVFLTIDNVPVTPFSLGHLLQLALPNFLLGLGLLVVGWVVYRSKPEEELNRVFAVFTTIAALFTFNQNYVGLIGQAWRETGLVTMLMVIPWIGMIGVVGFHLAILMTSPGPLSSPARKILPVFYALSIFFAVLGVITYLIPFHPATNRLTWMYILWIVISTVFAGTWSLASFFLSFWRARSRQVRVRAGIALAGLAIILIGALPFLAVLVINGPSFLYLPSLPYAALVLLGLLAYAILRYQIFPSRDQTLNRLLVFIYCVLAAQLVSMLASKTTAYLPLLGAALLASLLASDRYPISIFTGLLRRGETDIGRMDRFNHLVGILQSPAALAHTASGFFRDELEAEWVKFWLLDGEPGNPATDKQLQVFYDGVPTGNQPLSKELTERLVKDSAPVQVSPGSTSKITDWLPGEPAAVGSLWVPLVAQSQLVGVLALGPRWTGEVYSDADLRLAGILGGQLALALANASYLERLRQLPNLVRQVEENERQKIARELHDTTLQFLLVLTYGLDDLRNPDSSNDARVDAWQDRISAESVHIRDLIGTLRAPQAVVQLGFFTGISWLAESDPNPNSHPVRNRHRLSVG